MAHQFDISPININVEIHSNNIKFECIPNDARTIGGQMISADSATRISSKYSRVDAILHEKFNLAEVPSISSFAISDLLGDAFKVIAISIKRNLAVNGLARNNKIIHAKILNLATIVIDGNFEVTSSANQGFIDTLGRFTILTRWRII